MAVDDVSETETESALTSELCTRLATYLTESVAVVDAEGRVLRVLGPPGGALGLGHVIGRHIFEYCLPEDLPHALDLAVEALASSPGWHSTWEARLRNGAGEGVHFEIYIENCTDDPVIDGFVLRLRQFRSNSDAPARTDLGRELESLAGGVPLPIAFIGRDSHLYYVNDALRELIGERASEVEREGLQVLATGEERVALEDAVAELLDHPGELHVVFELVPNGEEARRVIEARFTGLGTGDQVLALFATLVDVTARHDEASELRRMAASDALTGLKNRVSTEAIIADRLADDPEKVGLCYLDLDGFKAINDTFGHDTGDDFLVDVARILSREVRSEDVVGRLGGDEFVVVVDLATPNESTVEPTALGAHGTRIARAIADHSVALGLVVTASVGIAVGRVGDSPRDLLRRGDHAMYEQKRSRRVESVRDGRL